MKGNLTVYKASAGSGKTFTLTAEYIALLLGDENPAHRHILAVTFTNKATAEMKERIISELCAMKNTVKTSSSAFTQAVQERLPGLSITELRKRAATALYNILHDYDNFRVETIDAFFQSLLGTLAHDLGLSAGLKVDINDKEVINTAVDNLLAALEERPKVRMWVLDYIRQRIDDNKRWDISREVKGLAYNLTKEAFMKCEDKLIPILNSEKELRDYRQKLKELSDDIASHLSKAAETLDGAIRNIAGEYNTFSYGSSLEKYIRYICQNPPGESPKSNIEKKMADSANWLRAADRKRTDLMTQAEHLRNLLIILEDIRRKGAVTMNSCQLSLRHLNPLRLLAEIRREVQAINAENNRFMLAATPLLFNCLVGKDDASFVFEKVGTQFRHVMIDEFQDTSNLQWSNFKNLMIENISQGNSCLLVGDVKQSIYRWRGGDWHILADIEKESAHNTAEIRHLDTNFRSSRCIVEFNNALFPHAAALLDTIGETRQISEIYADVQQLCCGKEGGEVRVYLNNALNKDTEISATNISDERNSQETKTLAEEIERLHEKGVAYKEMTILVRKNKEGVNLLRLFTKEFPHIPLISDEAFLLTSSPAVEILIHALRYLADDSDSISLAYTASTYCNKIENKQLSWNDICLQAKVLIPQKIAGNREHLRSLPLYELCETLVQELKLSQLHGAAPYVFCFMDAVLDFIDNGGTSIEQLLSYWEETLYKKAIPSGEVDGIRVLTIHKSKGLAFHTVFIPHCDWILEKDRPDDLLWCHPDTAPYKTLPLVPISAGKTMEASIYAADYKGEHLNRRIENLNMMYVAFTRAKQNLLIWGIPNKKDTVSNMADVLLKSNATSLAEEVTEKTPPAPDCQEKKQETSAEESVLCSFEEQVTFRQSNEAQNFINENAGTTDSTEQLQQQYIDQGKLLHNLFAMIRTKDDISEAIAQLTLKGVIPPETNVSKMESWIEKRLSTPQAAPWFDGSWFIFNERSILSRDTNGVLAVHRPDRVMTRNNETIVVDFKFGKRRDIYVSQVRNYCCLLKQMGHDNVRGYLWFVYSGEIEEVYP